VTEASPLTPSDDSDVAPGQAKPAEAAAPQPDASKGPGNASEKEGPRRGASGPSRSEEAVSEGETRFHAIFEHSGSGIALVDMQGWPVKCNPALQKLLGYTEEELCRMSFTQFTHVDDRALDRGLFGELVAGKRDKYEIEKRYITKDGRVIWGNLIATLVRDEEGVPKYAVGMVQDITERKNAEEDLRRVSERLRLATRAANIGIWDWDVARGEAVWDDAMYGLYGIHKEDADNAFEAWSKALAPEDSELAHAELQAALRGERGFAYEFRIVWPDGSVHFIKAASQTFHDAEGCPVRMVGVNYDVTEQRRAEEQNQRLIHDLGERVKELTALHHTARILQDEEKSVPELLQEIVSILPPAWQYPAVTAARIILGGKEFKTPNFSETQWSQVAQFTAGNLQGAIEVVYLEERPEEDIGPFLSEERNLIDSLAEMIRSALNRRFTQDKLRVSEERFAKAFHASPVPVVILSDRDRTFLEVNERWETVFGYSREETIGRTALELEFLNVEDRDRLRALGERQNFLRDEEVDVRTKQGEIRHVMMSAERFMNDGELYNIFLFNDITERKRAEEKLKASHEQLRALSERLRKAKDEEGIRIARELHDELGAALTSLKWSLTRLREDCFGGANAGGGGDTQSKIGEMVSLVDATINTVRRISSELRPGVLEDLGLIPAIEWHAQQAQANTGIVCRFESQVENVGLSRERATTVFRIFQEAMTNVLRHAGATRVNILVEEDDDEFVLEVSDNGRGITDSEKLGTSSLGLLGMRERAHSAGGRVEINGTPGKGTTLIVRVPLQADGRM
jgi:PAS domain S-box-containing protein